MGMSLATERFVSPSVATSTHRADIDGLRAVAVLSVVLFHLGVPGFSAGFVGVDLFFVISGFVITRGLAAQPQLGREPIVAFYARRVRRIAPALVVVVSVTTALGWLVLAPPDLMRLARSAVAVCLLSANFYFMGHGSYYAPAAQSFPLLNLWSLSVEEQFYLLFPWILAGSRKWTLRVQTFVLLAGAAVSLVCAAVLAQRSLTAAFYFTGTRAWELLAGAALALCESRSAARSGLSAVASFAGVGLVLAAISGAPVPFLSDWPAGAACAGTVLLIWAHRREGLFAARVLASPPLVFVGLISYSLYLWHWPMLALYRAQYPLELDRQYLVLAASFVLAVATWKFVEQPCRTALATRRTVFKLGSAACVLLLVGSALILASRGGPSRFTPYQQWMFAFDDYDATDGTRAGRCFLLPRHHSPTDFDRASCVQPTPGHTAYLLVGDSHAAHLWLGLQKAMPQSSILQATASGCRPLINTASADCAPFVDYVLKDVVRSAHAQAVVLSARWREGDLEPLLRTVRFLKAAGQQVVVLGPSVEYQIPLPRLLALASIHDDPSLVRRGRDPSLRRLDQEFRQKLKGTGAKYVSLYDISCPDGDNCTVTAPDGVPVQFDYGHYTREGATYIGAEVAKLIGRDDIK